MNLAKKQRPRYYRKEDLSLGPSCVRIYLNCNIHTYIFKSSAGLFSKLIPFSIGPTQIISVKLPAVLSSAALRPNAFYFYLKNIPFFSALHCIISLPKCREKEQHHLCHAYAFLRHVEACVFSPPPPPTRAAMCHCLFPPSSHPCVVNYSITLTETH